jgi:microcystin-dependent protein
MRRLSVLLVLLAAATLVLLPSASAQTRYIGSISLVPYTFAPVGTASCNGQLVSIAENDALFNLIGTTYGGDGQTTFALPDLRGRVAIHQGTDPSTGRNFIIGEKSGEESVTLTVGQLPAHSHATVASTSFSNTVSPLGAYWAPRARTFLFSAATNEVAMAPGALAQAGGSQPHDNVKPYLTLNYVIWLFGIFPSQN